MGNMLGQTRGGFRLLRLIMVLVFKVATFIKLSAIDFKDKVKQTRLLEIRDVKC